MSMTVSDLIQRLSQCDPDALVFSGVAYDNDTSFTNVSRVSEAGIYLIEKTFMGDYYEPSDDSGLVQGVFISG